MMIYGKWQIFAFCCSTGTCLSCLSSYHHCQGLRTELQLYRQQIPILRNGILTAKSVRWKITPVTIYTCGHAWYDWMPNGRDG